MTFAFGPNFIDDWVRVAEQEARHFLMVDRRLREPGAPYGDMPAPDGLSEAAYTTRADLLARLCVVPMMLEARGLDVTPAMIERLDKAGDQTSRDILTLILEEATGHVATGTRWRRTVLCVAGRRSRNRLSRMLRQNLCGQVKPPFNHAARRRASFALSLLASCNCPEPA